MTKKELLDAIHGQMIISCQAVKGEPLYVEEKSIMYLMARAAKQAWRRAAHLGHWYIQMGLFQRSMQLPLAAALTMC